MADLPSIEKSETLLTAMRRSYNLFAGAGFSVEARSAADRALPVGDQLARMIREEFDQDPDENLSLPQLYVVVQSTHPEALRQLVMETFTVGGFNISYDFLLRLPPETILTTNVDDLFQQVFSESKTHYLNDVYTSGSALSARSAIDLVQVHGSVRDPDRSMVFGPLDIASAYSVDPDRWNFIRQRLAENPTIFWGYGFADSGTLQAIHHRGGPTPTVGQAWVQVRRGESGTGIADYYRALGYSLIVAETSELLEFFSKESERVKAPIAPTAKDIENIPGPSEVAVRPREDFFTGAAPGWSDIYGGHLYHTAHYGEIVEQLNSQRDVLIGGIPGCGKTTLLMQVAAGWQTGRPKALFTDLSLSRAEMLARQIGDAEAVVILDNVASDIRVLEAFRGCPGVITLSADRDYAVGSVHHRLPEGLQVLPVTGQSRRDLVAIWKTIPERLRGARMKDPPVSWGVNASLYEFVKANVRESFLSQRLSEHLIQLSAEDPNLAEMLVLACHLRTARSALSTDVALAYFRSADLEYAELGEMLAKIGELLVEDRTFDADQDYFSARSSIVGEEVVRSAPRALLRTVLLRFFEEVSPLRIPDYESFKRKGYDSRVFSRAFSSVPEGEELYDKIYARTPSVYVLQQKALFLEKFGRYEAAFREIEAARNSWAGQRNLTIANTYFKVLFTLNYQRIGLSSEALDVCRRAVAGLRGCYEGDRRQGLHAMVYTDCCMKLSSVVDDDVAVRDLLTAVEMLEYVSVSEPYLDRPRHLLRAVKKRLASLGYGSGEVRDPTFLPGGSV